MLEDNKKPYSYVVDDLLKKQELFELALSASSDGIWDWHINDNYVYYSPRWKSMLGYEDDEIGDSLDEWKRRIHPDDLERVEDKVMAYFVGDISEYRVEFRMRHKNGRYIDMLARGKVINDTHGRPMRFVGTHVDLTRIKNIEEKYRKLFEASADAILIFDDVGIQTCNDRALELFCCGNLSEIRGLRATNICSDITDSNRAVAEDFKRLLAFSENNHIVHSHWSCTDKDGRKFPADARIALVPFEKSDLVQVILHDISQRREYELQLEQRYNELTEANEKIKKAQAQLLQSEKMASLGQLSAGVAHEINNPVGFVNSNIVTMINDFSDIFSLLEKYEALETCVENKELLTDIKKFKEDIDLEYLRFDIPKRIEESVDGLKRVTRIVHDLKGFSHSRKAKWEFYDLHAGIESSLNILANEIKYKAVVEKHYSDIPEVECIPPEIDQVFMNILINAAHAIDQDGVISVTTESVDDDSVRVIIGDNGQGISEKNLKHIFEPFFTTKEVGKGTGLGLSLVFGIIEKHHGQLDVASRVGEGTRFTITLPCKKSALIEDIV